MLTSFYFSLYLCIPKSLIIKITMKRKEYEKPTMQIVELRHTGMLMTSGDNQAASAGISLTYEEEDI